MGFDFDKLKVDYEKKEDKKVEDKMTKKEANAKIKELLDGLKEIGPVKELLSKKICIGPEDLTKEMACCASALVADKYEGDDKVQKALSDFTVLFVTGMFLKGAIGDEYIVKEEKDNGK